MKKIIEEFGEIFIGNNAQENFDIIDLSNQNDIWFHLDKFTSCHLVCKPSRNLTKNEYYYLAQLCKDNTLKYKNLKNISVMYTEIKNIKKDYDNLGSIFIKKKKKVNYIKI